MTYLQCCKCALPVVVGAGARDEIVSDRHHPRRWAFAPVGVAPRPLDHRCARQLRTLDFRGSARALMVEPTAQASVRGKRLPAVAVAVAVIHVSRAAGAVIAEVLNEHRRIV